MLQSNGLLAYRWVSGRVVSPQPAADADLDAARALLLASCRFSRPDLRSAAIHIRRCGARSRDGELSEAILLAVLGGAGGVGAGVVATIVYASTKSWSVVIPPLAWAGGLGAAMAIGAIAGLLPAIRAARLSPTEALRTV
jgi:hypothetical protein